MDEQESLNQPSTRWLDQVLGSKVQINREVFIYLLLIVLAILTRFIGLEHRVMSHDENTHVYFSWLLEQGRGYSHDPLSHGPLQFHLVALSYFLFGDNDATARFPAALFGVLAVGFVWLFRRWLGRTGAIVAAVLMLISPYMLFYSRYVRNEALVVPLVMATVWAITRYVETRESKWLYVLAVSLSLHFATKETSFIFTAQVLLFLGVLLAWQLINEKWSRNNLRLTFLAGFVLTALGSLVAAITYLQARGAETELSSELIEAGANLPGVVLSPVITFGGILAFLGLILIGFALILEFGRRLRTDFPLLDLVIVLATMTLPQLAALPATLMGWDPLAYNDPEAFRSTAWTVVVLVGISIAIGMAWRWREWLIIAGTFFVPFIVLFTTFFTNGQGVATGLVGSLGYWLVQHTVERGSQPHYYYLLIQIPIYEFLPAIGSLIAVGIGVSTWRSKKGPGTTELQIPDPQPQSLDRSTFPLLIFICYWALTSLVGYSYAGERMPWITVHIALPMILLAGWGIGKFLDSIDWRELQKANGWIVAGLLLFLLLSALSTFGSLFGPNPPFQGTEIGQLNNTAGFLAALGVAIACAIGLVKMAQGWPFSRLSKMVGVLFLTLLALVTVRAAFRAAYINYDYPTEFLVYAHSARGPKTALEQIEDLSIRTTGHLDIMVAYDNETTYPFWWYLRNYKNALYYGASPSRDLLNYPVILAGDPNWSKIDSFLEDRYYSFEYHRIWWPMQDYYNLTWERIREMLTSAKYRGALWDIWFDRDYTAYGDVTGRDYSLENWSPSNRMKLYVRKDIASLVWDYGIAPVILEPEEFVDPYVDQLQIINADLTFGQSGSAPGQFSRPRGIAVAPDGSIYVADTNNHRIQHLSSNGELISVWGQYANIEEGDAPAGTFNEPWGIDVAPDGTVYVADTWNHRIQHFTSDGQFLGMFGYFGQAGAPDAFWGPRDVAVDSRGRLFVTDTGNKRVVVFDAQGNALGEFGGFGLDLGGLDEPVGLGIDDQGRVYVADTWNQRIQIFEERGEAAFAAIAEWPVGGWIGQSLENKPYLAVGADGMVCTTDPESIRVLCFDADGEFLLGWGEYGFDIWQFGMPVGIAFDPSCSVWVTDSTNDRIMFFELELCEE
ncbi:MAG TPA: TIGR03663 family protein [Anaerolineae bacterium]|nr:TIGR03663 family protein [Anaerolineae bacterium]